MRETAMRRRSRLVVGTALGAALALVLAGGVACAPEAEPAAEGASEGTYGPEERGLMSEADHDLARRVEEAIREATGVETLEATAKEGAVALYGGVGTPGSRRQAEDAARGVEGVRTVRNKIAVREPPQQTR